MRRRISIVFLALCSAAAAQDDTFDWLVKGHATTAPTTAPATAASSPTSRPAPREAVAGTLTLNDGRQFTGPISTTAQKPLRVWVEGEHQYVDVALAEIQRISANVLWERNDKEWHFIASGSDVKEYTGKTYPARETSYTLVLRDGRKVSGGVVAPLYVQTSNGAVMFVLHKRDKGSIGAALADLKYIVSVEFTGGSTP